MWVFKSSWSLHICSLYNALNQHAYKLYILVKGVKFQWRGMIGEGVFWHNIYFLKSHTCIKKGKKMSWSPHDEHDTPNPPIPGACKKKTNAKEGNLHIIIKVIGTCMYHAPPPPMDIRIFMVSRNCNLLFFGGGGVSCFFWSVYPF